MNEFNPVIDLFNIKVFSPSNVFFGHFLVVVVVVDVHVIVAFITSGAVFTGVADNGVDCIITVVVVAAAANVNAFFKHLLLLLFLLLPLLMMLFLLFLFCCYYYCCDYCCCC